jgi:hypothetical protein
MSSKLAGVDEVSWSCSAGEMEWGGWEMGVRAGIVDGEVVNRMW